MIGDRLRLVAKIMSDSSPHFRDSVAELAFHFSNIEYMAGAERHAHLEILSQSIFEKLSVECETAHIRLAPEAVEEIVGAIFINALDLAASFPIDGAPS